MTDQKDGLRDKIEASIEKQELERKIKLQKRRLELAQEASRFYKAKNYAEATKTYHLLLRLMEETKGVKQGGLRPDLFDKKTEIADLIVLSGVFWDLAKIYDRTKSNTKGSSDFKNFLQKYVAFSKGMPYQALCAESLRKYCSQEKPVHGKDFREAYTLLSGKKCFVATALMDLITPEEMLALQNFRDQKLMSSITGKSFVSTYYKVGPFIAWILNRSPVLIRSFAANRIKTFSNWI